mgnify:CR=1 FL=1
MARRTPTPRRSSEQWRELVQRQRRSGLSIAAFSRQEGPVYQAFVRWCRKSFLVDVLQRVGTHPAKEVIELTPRVWKRRFGDEPLRSDLARPG